MNFEQAVEKLKGMHPDRPRCLEYSYWVHGMSEERGRCRIYVENILNATGTTWEQAFQEAEMQVGSDIGLSQAPQGEPEVGNA